MHDIRNILNIINESESDVKPHLPESNPGETSDFVKNNARFAAHGEETLDSMVAGFEVETLPEFLEDEGVEVPDSEEDLNEYKWQPRADGQSKTEVTKVFQCNDCDGDGTVVDETEDDDGTHISCRFLDGEGGCGIHPTRPGVCYLYPFSTWTQNEKKRARVHATFQFTGDCPGFYLSESLDSMKEVLDDYSTTIYDYNMKSSRTLKDGFGSLSMS